MATSTGDPTASFFADLAARGAEPLLQKATGRTRFEIVDGRHTRQWVVSVDKGRLEVIPGGSDAACVIRAEKGVFDRLVTGRSNAIAAVLRGDLQIDGDWRLVVRMQRLFPGPRASRRRKTT